MKKDAGRTAATPPAKQTAMIWKLWTRDETVSPPMEGSEEYYSREAALLAACSKMKVAHVVVLRIEQPSGPPIELEAIRHWCDGQPKTP
jgi:hypothetical protein